MYLFSHLLQQRSRQSTEGVNVRRVRALLLGDVESVRESFDRLLESANKIVLLQRLEQHRGNDFTRFMVNQNYSVRGVSLHVLQPAQEIRQCRYFAFGFNHLTRGGIFFITRGSL